MGNYNSQYENYYHNLVNKRRNYGGYGYSSQNNKSFNLDGKFILKRLMRDLIGVFILFLFIITCKLVVTPQTTAAYNYSKEFVNKSYDYKQTINYIKTFNFNNTEDKVTEWLDAVKAKITGGKTLKDKLKTDFILPIEGAVASTYDERTNPITNEKEFHYGVDIAASLGTEVLSSGEGKVKECGEDGQLGKYVLIDHGSGLETKYGYLSEILVKKGDTIKKGQTIAKSGGIDESKEPHLHFEFLYMGENKDPQQYFNFSNNSLTWTI